MTPVTLLSTSRTGAEYVQVATAIGPFMSESLLMSEALLMSGTPGTIPRDTRTAAEIPPNRSTARPPS